MSTLFVLILLLIGGAFSNTDEASTDVGYALVSLASKIVTSVVSFWLNAVAEVHDYFIRTHDGLDTVMEMQKVLHAFMRGCLWRLCAATPGLPHCNVIKEQFAEPVIHESELKDLLTIINAVEDISEVTTIEQVVETVDDCMSTLFSIAKTDYSPAMRKEHSRTCINLLSETDKARYEHWIDFKSHVNAAGYKSTWAGVSKEE